MDSKIFFTLVSLHKTFGIVGLAGMDISRKGPNFMIGESTVGRKVVDHLPDSWDWKIQLWTLDDCREFCADELNPNGRYDIKLLEPFMIQKLRPSLNTIYNLNPGTDHTPKSEREKRREAELDKAFRKIFENKSKSWK